jgi:hypothetical protein
MMSDDLGQDYLQNFLKATAMFEPWSGKGQDWPHPQREQDLRRDDATVFAELLRPSGYANLRAKRILSPAKYQGESQACTSFAIAAAAEAAVRKAQRPPVTLAPWFIHTCLAHSPVMAGVSIPDAIGRVLAGGIALTNDSNQMFPESQCATTARLFIKGAMPINDIQAAKLALENDAVVVCAIRVNWQTFIDLQPDDRYDYQPDSHANTHSVCVVGYDDKDSVWLILNSLGPKWCSEGYGLIPYDRCDIFNVVSTGPAAVVSV